MLVAEMVWIRPRGRVDLEMGIEMEIGGLGRHCGACDDYGVDGVLALVLLGFDLRERRRKKRKKRKRKRQR